MTSSVEVYNTKFFRQDIQGVRAISAILIMIHHIWTQKVSGGVDVFFVISGFLMTSILLREYALNANLSPLIFYSRISSRILPAGAFFLALTAGLSFVFIPVPIWKFGANEFIASTLQLENWELHRTSVDYLARENPPSQFQQYWALSMQVQFYILIPIILSLALALPTNRKILSTAAVLLATSIASFAWSIYYTNDTPERAYFNTFARLWEFLAGALTAVLYPLSRPQKHLHRIKSSVYAASLIFLFLFGFLSPATLAFPGWAAALPVIAATLLIIAGKDEKPNFIRGIVANKLLSKLGEISFTIYLCHWPILIFYQHHLDRTDLSVQEGALVIAISIIISFLASKYIEDPAQNSLKSAPPLRALAKAAIVLFTLLIIGISFRQAIIHLAKQRNDPSTYFSSADNDNSPTSPLDKIDFKYWLTLDYDRPHSINSCLSGPICSYGNIDSDKVIALVGASHAAHFQPALERIAIKYGFHLITILTNQDNLKIIDSIKPVAIITNATKTPSKVDEQEFVSEAMINEWEFYSNLNIPILAIRDTPRFYFYQNACLWKNKNMPTLCSIDRSQVYLENNPSKKFEASIPNFFTIDLSNILCDTSRCFASQNGLPIFYDKHHFSNTFISSASEAILHQIELQAPDIYRILVND